MKKSAYGSIVIFITALFVMYAFCLNTAGEMFANTIKTTLTASDVGVSCTIGAFIFGFLLSGSMFFYTIVSETSTNNTRGVALSITNSLVFLFNSIILLIPYLFSTKISFLFFTYMWVLPFCVLISILCLYFIKETYELTHFQTVLDK